MTLLFTCNDESQVIHNETITTYSDFYCVSEKVVHSGSYYGEITHISGSNTHFFGVENECGSINWIPCGDLNNIYVQTYGCFSESSDGLKEDRRVELNMESEHTVGLLLNIEKHFIMIFYKNTFHTFSYSTRSALSSNYKYKFGGGTFSNSQDQITLNFGEKPFAYDFKAQPFGYNAKMRKLKYSYKFHNNQLSLRVHLCFLLISINI